MNSHSLNSDKQNTKDAGLFNEIISSDEGKRILSCIQCGTCAGICPVSNLYKESPRQIFLMVRNGMMDEALSNVTPWICASCYKCTVYCPAQIKITEVMYKLKRMSLHYHMESKQSDVKLFYKAFVNQVKKNGRSYEIGLMLRYLMFNHPINLLKQTPMGIQMMMSGTLPLFPHKIKNTGSFQKIVKRAMLIEEMNCN